MCSDVPVICQPIASRTYRCAGSYEIFSAVRVLVMHAEEPGQQVNNVYHEPSCVETLTASQRGHKGSTGRPTCCYNYGLWYQRRRLKWVLIVARDLVLNRSSITL